MMLGLELRRLELADLDAIERIERASYRAPWSRSMFASELAKPSSLSFGAVDDSGDLVGYVVLSRYVDAWHVMNVAVAPERRRQGIASALLQRLLELTKDDPLRGYTLEVRVSNAGAIALYERFGFRQKGLRRGYYTDNREDALIMWRDADSARRGIRVGRRMHALWLRPGERDRADPQCRVFGAARPDHGDPAVSQRDEHATHSARRERPAVEILAFHHDDRMRGGGTKPIQLLPEPARSDGRVKVANCLPFDCSLRPYDVVPSPKRLEADRDPEPPERRGNTTRDLAMVDRHQERRKGTHHHEHARCGRPVLVAMRSMATIAVEAEPTW